MPFLRIEVSTDKLKYETTATIAVARTIVHEVTGLPNSMIEVALATGVPTLFGNEGVGEAANLHLTSFALNAETNTVLSRRFARLVWDHFGIPADRAFVFFENVAGAHMTGWNGRTFADLQQQRSGGRVQLSNRIFGRVVGSPKGRPGSLQLPPVPLGGLEVELWRPMAASLASDDAVQQGHASDSFLGRCVAAEDGYFEIFYSDQTGFEDRPIYLELRIFEKDQRLTVDDSEVLRRFASVVHPFQVDRVARIHPMGHIKIEFYEYDPDWPFPYAVPASIRQSFSSEQWARYLAAGGRFGPTLRALIAKNNSTRGGISIDEIQRSYPENDTVSAGSKSRSDDYFAERMLNAHVPPIFSIEKSDAAQPETFYVLELNWSQFNRRPDLTALSFRARFRSDGTNLSPHDISIGLNGEDDPANFTTFTPSAPEWGAAKRVVRSMYSNMAARVSGHLATTHFVVEQYGIAFLRNVQQSPIRELLFPFLREVLAINERGRHTLIGGATPIVYLVTPLASDSITIWMTKSLGRHDWKNFSPRKPICKGHRYANVANAFWEAATAYVDEFFRDNQAEILNNWAEILLFSDDLAGHSPEFVDPPMETKPESWAPYCTDEIPGHHAPGDRVISSLTSVSANPPQDDVSSLKQLCIYVIYQSVFVHSWVHRHMLQDLGEIRYSGVLRNGGFGPEDDDTLVAPPLQAALSLNLSHVLGNMHSGSLMENEDGDVPAGLVEQLKAQAQVFELNGFPLEHLGARLNT